jgi:hypothetical protein
MSISSNVNTNKRSTPVLFFIGDIHGDPVAFLKTLNMTGMLNINHTIIKNLINFQSDKDTDITTITNLIKDITWNEKYVNTESKIIFLGDILDNKRPNQSSEALRVGSEEFIINTMKKLKTDRINKKINLIWVLGNHDVYNTLQNHDNEWCHKYSHNSYCKSEGGYKDERMMFVIDAIKKLDAVVLWKYDDILSCHGGLCPGFIDYIFKNKTVCDKIQYINKGFIDCINNGELSDPWDRGDSPIWCRNVCSKETYEKVFKQFECTSLFVGHTISTDKNDITNIQSFKIGDQVKKIVSTERMELMDDYTTYFTDVAMSSAFELNSSPTIYRCLKVKKENNKWNVIGIKCE